MVSWWNHQEFCLLYTPQQKSKNHVRWPMGQVALGVPVVFPGKRQIIRFFFMYLGSRVFWIFGQWVELCLLGLQNRLRGYSKNTSSNIDFHRLMIHPINHWMDQNAPIWMVDNACWCKLFVPRLISEHMPAKTFVVFLWKNASPNPIIPTSVGCLLSAMDVRLGNETSIVSW